MPPETADILVHNGTVLTLDGPDTRLSDGAVAVRGDTIAAVGPAEAFAGWTAARRIDAGGGIIMPGLVNAHTHAAMTCFRGLADDLPLMTWLNDYIFPAEAQLDSDTVLPGDAAGLRRDDPCGHHVLLRHVPVRGGRGPRGQARGHAGGGGRGALRFPLPQLRSAGGGVCLHPQAARNLARRPADHRRGRTPLALSLRTGSSAEGRGAWPGSGTRRLMIHVSETAAEVAKVREPYGRTPVGLLADLGVLSPRLLAAHCVVLTEDDIDLLGRFQVKVAHNPESNMKLASGIAPVPELLRAGICVGLGTDGCASNNDLDLFREMDTAAKLHKVHSGDPTVLDAPTVLRMATIEGARALGLDGVTGSLEPGKRADIIVIDTRKPHLTPMFDPASHLVYAARGSDVAVTIINGTVVMENGRLPHLDLASIMADVRRIARELARN